MTRIILATLSALALSGCAAFSTSATPEQQVEAYKAIQGVISDPRCGHTDRVQGDIGGLGSGLHVFLERNCPMPAPAAVPVG